MIMMGFALNDVQLQIAGQQCGRTGFSADAEYGNW